MYADFRLRRDEIAEIQSLAENARSIDRIYNVELKDNSGVIYAEIEKTLYISKKKGNR